MQNYFNYFTEIEEHFQRRRGSLLLLSTLDWALIETWREAEIPLDAVLRGIDDAFDKYEARQRTAPGKRLRQVNGLAWCAQAVMESAEQLVEAATGVADKKHDGADAGFEAERVREHLESAAVALETADIQRESMGALAASLRAAAAELASERAGALRLEDLERRLTAIEEKLFAILTTHVPEELLLRFKTEAARELAAYRSRMGAVQLRQIESQFVHKRLLEHYRLPRLSLFYMRQA